MANPYLDIYGNPVGLDAPAPNYTGQQASSLLGDSPNPYANVGFTGWGNQNYDATGGTGQNSFGAPPPQTDSSSPSGGKANASGAGNLVGGAIGAYEYFNAQKALKELNAQPAPNYTVSSELQNAYGRAEGMAGQGFTSAEKAGYQNSINQGDALAYDRASKAGGGNLSNVISAGINSQNIASADKFATADATLHRQNMAYADSLAGQIQTQKNLATQQNIAYRNWQLQQWNAAASSGISSFANSFNLSGVANTAAMAALA